MGIFCDKIIEAGWLTAVIVTPLFFNWYSNRVFEASKVALLRSITVVMLTAWLIKILEAGNWRPALSLAEGLKVGSWKRKANTQYLISNIQYLVSRNPLLLSSLLLVASYILATITSVSSRVSFWGSYYRQQGLYVTFCYIAIFFLTLETLRTRQQLERLITVILITSLSVSLYGIIQHYEADPLAWLRARYMGRVESTLGNPVLISAYLIMVVPWTVWRIIHSFSLIRTRGEKAGLSLVQLGCYLLLLIFQLSCLVFAPSRGAGMGLMAGALFFFLLLAILRRRRGLAVAAIGVSIALLAILAILNLPNSPLTPPKGIPYIERLAEISKDIMHDRSLIWQGAVNMITADRTRTIIGYGPETMGLIFHPYLDPDWAAEKDYQQVADQCHNETLDAWITSGLIGLSAYLVLFVSIFYYGLKQLGLIANFRQRTFFATACLAGGFSGVVIPWLMDRTLKWIGVGIPAGILLALVIYLLTFIFRQSPTLRLGPSTSSGGTSGQASNPSTRLRAGLQPFGQAQGRPLTSNFQILLIILLSTLVAHFVEIQFGIAITATRTYFWIYAALLAIVGSHWLEKPVPEAAAETLPPPFLPPKVGGERGGAPRRHGRQRGGRRRKACPEQGRRVARPSAGISTTLNGSALSNSFLVGLILATTSFDLITHEFELSSNGPVIFGLLSAIWLFGGITVPAANLRTYVLGSLLCFLPFTAVHAAIVLPGAGVERATFVYYAYFLSVIFAVAVALMIGSDLHLPLHRLRAWWLYSIIGVGALLLILNTNLKAAQADIYYKFAQASEERGEIDTAISVYGRAIQLAPRWSQYHVSLGWAYGLKAITISDADQRADLFEESLKSLERARQMSPSDPDIIAKLGHVYWNWGSLTSDLEQKAEKLEVALAYYQQAVTLSPLNHWHLLKDDIVQTYLRLGETYTAIDKPSQAAEAYQKATEIAPDSYEGHKDLASAYLQLGRLDEALEEAKTARDLAPEEERSGLDDLIAELEGQKK